MEIVCRKNITTVFELSEIKPDAHWIIQHFLYNYDEVLYFVEKDLLKAVVSVGDIFKYLEGKKETILNIEFTCVLEKKLMDAQAFFLEHPTIHELPVIDESGCFVGIVNSGHKNPERVWTGFRLRIRELYYNVTDYYQKASKRFMSHFKGKVFLINLPNDGEVLKRLQDNREEEVFRRKNVIHPLELLRCMSEQDEKDYWGPAYEPGISKRFVGEFSNIKVSKRNGCQYYENNKLSRHITFENGKRCVTNKNTETKRKIYLVGPCTIFGAYVLDEQTVEYYLQQFINNDEFYQVVNMGSLGLYNEFQYLLTEFISDEDIVVLASQSKKLLSIMNEYDNVYYLGNYSDIFDTIENPTAYILDTFRHVNYKISEEMARRIYASIKPYMVSKDFKLKDRKESFVQDYFISWDIFSYYKEFALNYNLANPSGKIGAIVMNCNPFTKGHRYLIEYAASKVDSLIVFVVEEDASVFGFADRMEMVKLGTEDIINVKVVPSGKYNISKSTFAQYFDKEKEIHKIDSMEYDLRIFCEVIADCMKISYRFAGEEPTDIVTRQYNETMKYILPQYDIKFIEVPRLKRNKEEYISASKVRQYLNCKDWESASCFLPKSTIDYLKGSGIVKLC